MSNLRIKVAMNLTRDILVLLFHVPCMSDIDFKNHNTKTKDDDDVERKLEMKMSRQQRTL